MRTAERLLVSMCEERARMLQDQFAVSVNHVHALAILISTFHYQKHPSAIDQSTFAGYTAMTSFERPLLSGVAYAQRVEHADRDEFESEQGWIIKTMKKEPSPVQDEYAPVIFSQETISYIEALDMMSGEEDRENIVRARATGKAVLTSPFRLLESNHLGVILTFPVYRWGLPADATEEERVKATVGYIGGAFDVESLVENLLRQLAGNQDILVNVYDVTNTSLPLVMYGSQHSEGYVPLTHVSMLDFGDPFRKHQMECRYSQKPPIPWPAITTPSGIFVICMLVGYILYAAYNRYVNVVEDYRKMEELKVQAEAADVAKSQFLATVSHEIRTPMNGVLGMLDMLLDTELNATQKDYAQTAQVCGKALIQLINEVLDRAKIEAGKLEMEAVPFDLRSILDEVISLFSAKSRDKGIELAVFVSKSVPKVLIGDPGRFRQIVTNLVGNSVKFTDRGHIFVKVHLAEQSDFSPDAKAKVSSNALQDTLELEMSKNIFNTLSGREAADGRNNWESFKMSLSDNTSLNDVTENVSLMVTVEDTGVGIPLHAQDRVFTPFMQADSSTSRNYGGTGIGLSISKCLVELMGGQINFISRPNVGSTFTFTAILKKCGETAASNMKRAPPEILPICFNGMKAVVLDDKPVRGSVTKYHLQRLGIIVDVVSSFKVAMSAITGQNGCTIPSSIKHPNIVLIEKDVWISGMFSGLSDLLLKCKADGKVFPMPKVVLLVTTELDRAMVNGPIDTAIMKPLRASLVAACLEQVLGVSRQQKKEAGSGSRSLRNILVGKRILVVDDNMVNRRVAEGALRKYGAKVVCAESGKDALSLLEIPHEFDACFMDVQMPEMDGFEATRQIRLVESKANETISDSEAAKTEKSSSRRWHLPVLAMTADVIQATYEECMKCGMDGYVSKPFEEEQLYKAVARFFESKPTTDS